MAQRGFLDRVISIASALMLVVAVLASPIRPHRSNSGHARPDCLRRNFGLPSKQSGPTRPSASSLGSTPVRVKAVTSESKEDAVKLTRRPGHFLHSPPVPPPSLRPAKFAAELDRAVHPLRC
jgi:hypothetical protein